MQYAWLWRRAELGFCRREESWFDLSYAFTQSQFLFWILTHTRQTFLLWLGGVRWLMPSWCRSLKYETTAVAIDTRLLSLRCTFSFRMYSLQSRYLWLAGRPTCPSPMVVLKTLSLRVALSSLLLCMCTPNLWSCGGCCVCWFCWSLCRLKIIIWLVREQNSSDRSFWVVCLYQP